MIINKVNDFWTKEDNEALLDLKLKQNEILSKAREATEKAGEKPQRKTFKGLDPETGKEIEIQHEYINIVLWEQEGFNKIQNEIEELTAQVEKRYIESKGEKGIIKDALEIINAFSKSDFLSFVNSNLYELAKLSDANSIIQLNSEAMETIKKQSLENFDNCFLYLRRFLETQIKALDHNSNMKGLEEIERALFDKVSQWYNPPIEERPLDLSLHGSLPSYSYRKPKSFNFNLTKVNNKIFSNDLTNEELLDFDIDITPNSLKKKKNGIEYLVSVGITPDPNIEGIENLTPYDKGIHNAILSIVNENGNNFFTPKQVATFYLYGNNPKNSKPSEASIEEAERSIERLRHRDIKIDFTDHMKLNGLLHEGEKFVVKNYMIPTKACEAKINGQKLSGYMFIDNPPLGVYGAQVGQLGQCKADMLNIPANMDSQKLVIRDFLMEEIKHMENNPAWNRTITIDRILRVGGEDPEEIQRKKRSTLISFVKTVLFTWKEKGHIEKYKINKTGKSYTSVTITPKKEEKKPRA